MQYTELYIDGGWGVGRPEAFSKGCFVQPTVFADVKSKMTIAQEEIFGRVLSILPYDSEAEAVEIANGSIYGLAGGVWSADPERAIRLARRGRELGVFGLEEYLQVKSIAR